MIMNIIKQVENIANNLTWVSPLIPL